MKVCGFSRLAFKGRYKIESVCYYCDQCILRRGQQVPGFPMPGEVRGEACIAQREHRRKAQRSGLPMNAGAHSQ